MLTLSFLPGPPGYQHPIHNKHHFTEESQAMIRKSSNISGTSRRDHAKLRRLCIEGNVPKDTLQKDFASYATTKKRTDEGWTDQNSGCNECQLLRSRECFVFINEEVVWYKHNGDYPAATTTASGTAAVSTDTSGDATAPHDSSTMAAPGSSADAAASGNSSTAGSSSRPAAGGGARDHAAATDSTTAQAPKSSAAAPAGAMAPPPQKSVAPPPSPAKSSAPPLTTKSSARSLKSAVPALRRATSKLGSQLSRGFENQPPPGGLFSPANTYSSKHE